MGYYTRYELTVTPELDIAFIQNRIDGGRDLDDLEELSDETTKWYEHEKDMRALSKDYPDHLFQLDGRGEEQGDVWRKYFKDGKMQKWVPEEQEPEPFDETKLK